MSSSLHGSNNSIENAGKEYLRRDNFRSRSKTGLEENSKHLNAHAPKVVSGGVCSVSAENLHAF